MDIIVEPIFMPEGKRLLTSRCMSAATGRPLIFAGVIRWPGTADTAIAQGGTAGESLEGGYADCVMTA
ncbi:hypothetical protein Y958_15105 [Nitrospirillum viridazoti CBAmc]|uniref:Uncharacterized protein n=1 Tax=Nitrospirillum viridazoti CBAmc TaxID=1441467 RepID=A0A248JVY9_9PROT|nr:hypothetical protein Y958_15105 [Nitrospirillum amazonense CBAmc]